VRICIISTMCDASWGGSEELCEWMAHEALDQGHEVALVLKRWPKIPAPVCKLLSRGAKAFFSDH
jgi:hypothetical protein